MLAGMLPPLVLTGPPAVGKTSTARRLAGSRPRAACLDVDDLRHLVVSGHLAPWDGEEGQRQRDLGVENACSLARRFLEHGIEVVLADAITTETLPRYRQRLPYVVVVHLSADIAEARRRAATRPVYLTELEFETLHREDRERSLVADHHLDVTDLDLDQQFAAVARWWHG